MSEAVRRYSRDELFNIAQSIEECKSICDELERLRTADLSGFELDWTERGALGRMNSELDLESELFGGGQRRVRRMTSSPALRAHRAPALDGLPDQVRVKYARLLETVSSSAAAAAAVAADAAATSKTQLEAGRRQFALGGAFGPLASQPGRRAPLNRTASSDPQELSARDEAFGSLNSARAAERPARLFGPLRRLDPTNRGQSDEPMSLAYSINTNPAQGPGRPPTLRPGLGRAGGETGDADADDLAYCEQEPDTPIKRIAAPDRALDGLEQPSADDDGDDFDITSLLSITVLSDIKTIRHDLKSFGRQSSNLGTKRPVARARSHDLATRMPARSLTALEFNYTNNKSLAQRPSKQQQRWQEQAQEQSFTKWSALSAAGQAPGAHHQQHQYAANSGGSESLPFEWSSASSYYAATEMAPAPSPAPPQLSGTNQHRATVAAGASPALGDAGNRARQPIDESRARIIEEFKAQVRARANAPLDQCERARVVSAKSSDTAAAPTSKGSSGAGGSEQGGKIANNGPNGTRPAKNASGGCGSKLTVGEGREALVAESNAVTARPKCESASTATVATSTGTDLASLKAGASVNAGQLGADEVAAAAGECLGATKARVDGVSAASRPSNIPRLISALRPARPAQSTSDVGKGAEPMAAASSKPAAKFISRYKALRGKSLADEVEESAPPAIK